MRWKVSSGGPLWFAALVGALLLTACTGPGSDGLTIGDKAPEFSLPAASGSTVSLSDYAGTATLLYFHMADG